MFAKCLDSFEVMPDALQVRLEMSVPVLSIADGETFEVHHNLLGGNRILATTAHYLHMFALQLSLVGSLV
jgi:hypothetical protein